MWEHTIFIIMGLTQFHFRVDPVIVLSDLNIGVGWELPTRIRCIVHRIIITASSKGILLLLSDLSSAISIIDRFFIGALLGGARALVVGDFVSTFGAADEDIVAEATENDRGQN